MVGVTKMPFVHSMIIDTILDSVSKTGSDLVHGANDIQTFGEHLLAIGLRNVVEIDVNGDPLIPHDLSGTWMDSSEPSINGRFFGDPLIASSCTPPWLPSGWGCRGRRLSTA
jgi:hypothetical protein